MPGDGAGVRFSVDGREVEVPDDGRSLLEVLRDVLGIRSPKDGCSPQGQCGCCTVWVDGSPRVACVTPVRRVAGRAVTTVDGLPDADTWAESFAATGASQCGFCTPGIVMRLAALSPEAQRDDAAVRRALLAHVCRCTGWNSIVEACVRVGNTSVAGRADEPLPAGEAQPGGGTDPTGGRDRAAAEERAQLEGGIAQAVGPDVALGRGGFADDLAPVDALVAVRSADGWVVGETLAEARAAAGKVQGRRTTAPPTWPVDVPDGEWVRTLRTTWVDPAYLEPDASWCAPGGDAATALGNGGAFGGKVTSEVGAVARRLADEHGRPVRVLLSREDTVRLGPKRPPVAVGVRADGSGVALVVRPRGPGDERAIVAAISAVSPGVEARFVDVAGPHASADLRGAGWAEVAAAVSSITSAPDRVTAPNGAEAHAVVAPDGSIHVTVRCGRPLDEVVLRSYCAGAAHMALGMVRSEAIAVDEAGEPLDLTMRSFGVVRAVDTPRIDVEIVDDDRRSVNGSDAVFAAVLAAVWRADGFPPSLPGSR